jgi:glycosyltransferase involved in cell wall biosynthesis
MKHGAAPAGGEVCVSVVIKALNEERNIERAVRSSLDAIAALGRPGEVVLADSLSTDRTVEIASRFPIRIVQLAAPDERCCGVGAQLGFQVARGRYLYILDGDMELDAGFLPAAIAALEADPGLAGVAGIVQEMHVANFAFRNRAKRSGTTTPSRSLHSLDMGGLYRRAAVEAVGYLTDRNLHAFEEFELGARLVTRGARLERLGVPSVRHYGHTDDSLAILLRRWRSRYAFGHGELLRGAIGRPHGWFVLRRLRAYRLQFGLVLAWLAAAAGAWITGLGVAGFAALVTGGYALLFGALAVKKRSVPVAALSLLSWHVGLAGLVRGFVAARRFDPSVPPPYRVLQ